MTSRWKWKIVRAWDIRLGDRVDFPRESGEILDIIRGGQGNKVTLVLQIDKDALVQIRDVEDKTDACPVCGGTGSSGITGLDCTRCDGRGVLR